MTLSTVLSSFLLSFCHTTSIRRSNSDTSDGSAGLSSLATSPSQISIISSESTFNGTDPTTFIHSDFIAPFSFSENPIKFEKYIGAAMYYAQLNSDDASIYGMKLVKDLHGNIKSRIWKTTTLRQLQSFFEQLVTIITEPLNFLTFMTAIYEKCKYDYWLQSHEFLWMTDYLLYKAIKMEDIDDTTTIIRFKQNFHNVSLDATALNLLTIHAHNNDITFFQTLRTMITSNNIVSDVIFELFAKGLMQLEAAPAEAFKNVNDVNQLLKAAKNHEQYWFTVFLFGFVFRKESQLYPDETSFSFQYNAIGHIKHQSLSPPSSVIPGINTIWFVTSEMLYERGNTSSKLMFTDINTCAMVEDDNSIIMSTIAKWEYLLDYYIRERVKFSKSDVFHLDWFTEDAAKCIVRYVLHWYQILLRPSIRFSCISRGVADDVVEELSSWPNPIHTEVIDFHAPKLYEIQIKEQQIRDFQAYQYASPSSLP